MGMTEKITRKNSRHLRVPVLPEEEIKIKENAAEACLSIAEYLRRLALGHNIHGTIDQKHILELSKINGDLGRLGGLLKLWLTMDKRVASMDRKAILLLLERIYLSQDCLLEVVKKL